MAANLTNSTLLFPDANANTTKIYLHSNGTAAFITNLVISFILGVIFILVVSCMRSRMLKIYSPRVLLIDTIFPLGKLPNSFFAWVIPGWMARDDDIFNYAGFDALVYVRFLKLCLKCAIAVMPYGILVLLPLNLYGGGTENDALTKSSMSNVTQNSPKLWAHLFAVWIYSLLLYYLIYQEWKVFLLYKQADLARGYTHQFTVLLRDIPESLQNNERLKGFMDQIGFTDQVQSLVVVEDLSNWQCLVQRHDDLVWQVERARAVYDATQERPEHRVKLCGAYVDSISSFEEQLEETQSLLEKELESEHARTCCALVMFTSLRSASIAVQTLWETMPLQLHVEPAPEPQDIIWPNLKMPLWKRWMRFILSNCQLFLLVIFWLIPIGLLASVLSLENLTKTFTWLTPVLDYSPVVKGFLGGFLPCIGLYIFFAILPLLMIILSESEGLVSHSSVDVSVICKLFIFKIFNQFLILVLSGSIINSLANIIKSPLDFPILLGQSLPSMSTFFINYTVIGAFLLHPLELSRIVPIIISGIKMKWLCKTSRETEAAWRPPPPRYHLLYPENLFIFIVGLCYSIIAPLITPFFVFYFAMGYMVWVHQVMCVYIPIYRLGGSVWPYVCSRMLVAMALFQLLMVGIFALKENFTIMVLTAPLPFFTLSFYLFIQNYFTRVSKYLTLSTADSPPETNINELQQAFEKYKLNHCIPPLFELSGDQQELRPVPDQTNSQTIETVESAEANPQNGEKLIEGNQYI